MGDLIFELSKYHCSARRDGKVLKDRISQKTCHIRQYFTAFGEKA
jgi:hypothetical protein